MTKKDRVKEALITRNKALEQAEQDYLASVEKLDLPPFKIDWSEAMTIESKRQDLLIAPIRDTYHIARRTAWGIYRAVS